MIPPTGTAPAVARAALLTELRLAFGHLVVTPAHDTWSQSKHFLIHAQPCRCESDPARIDLLVSICPPEGLVAGGIGLCLTTDSSPPGAATTNGRGAAWFTGLAAGSVALEVTHVAETALAPQPGRAIRNPATNLAWLWSEDGETAGDVAAAIPRVAPLPLLFWAAESTSVQGLAAAGTQQKGPEGRLDISLGDFGLAGRLAVFVIPEPSAPGQPPREWMVSVCAYAENVVRVEIAVTGAGTAAPLPGVPPIPLDLDASGQGEILVTLPARCSASAQLALAAVYDREGNRHEHRPTTGGSDPGTDGPVVPS